MTSKAYFTHWITKPGPEPAARGAGQHEAVAALPKDAATQAVRRQAHRLLRARGLPGGVPLDRLQEWTQLWEEVKAG